MTGPGERESARGGRRRVPRLILWNALLLSAGLLAVAVGSEVWLRSTTPFVGSHFPRRFVPGVGSLGKPRTELRWTNGVDYWQISRTNRWGFVDREPPEPEAAAGGCHLTVIGDSFVEAKEVALADRSHVVLEALAAERLPRLGITTSAFGRGGTGQIHQLAFYDEYARRLRPKVVVLYFHFNDFADNSPLLSAAIHGFDPERMPYPGAVRDEAGAVRLRPPHPRFADHRLAEASGLSPSTLRALRQGWEGMRGKSFFLDWLYAEAGARVRARSRRDSSTGADRIPAGLDPGTPVVWRNRWQERPRSVAIDLAEAKSAGEPLPAVLREAWDLTAFALDEFAARAERDGASLVILLTHRTRHARAGGVAAAVRSLAEPRGIPVVDFFESLHRRGLDGERARWRHDDHWNENGHRWAAEALLEHLESHPEVCGAPEADRSGRTPEPS